MIFLDDRDELLSPTMAREMSSAGTNGSAFSPAMEKRPLEIRKNYGRWEIGEFSQNGSFFIVSQARPSGQDGPFLYAVKTLRHQWQHSAIGSAILQREAELGRLISHPHLVPVLDGILDGPEAFLVQPWLSGNSLHKMITSGQIAKTGEALWIGRQVAEALCELERHEFCHCDIKPGNIMISPTGHATLIDLGLARRTNEASLPIDRMAGGTPKYMAPELFDSPKTIDIRADLFSLGLVMLEMLFGKNTLVSDDPHNRILARHWRLLWQQLERNQMLNQQQRTWLAELESLLRSMVETDVEKRPRSACQVKRKMIQLELMALLCWK